MISCFSQDTHHNTLANDWNWLLEHITPPMKHALTREAHRILQNPYDVEDVMQDALIQGALFRHQLREDEKAFSWMFSIVRREAYACLSRQASYEQLVKTVHILTIRRAVNLEKDWLVSEEYRRIKAVVKTLDAATKQIIMMRITTDWNLHEIAHHIGLNYHTVRSKYYRALSTLRRKML